MSATLTISIGRNMGASVMSLCDWRAFCGMLETFREGYNVGPDTVATGVSSFNGVEEETAVFQWFDAEPLTPTERVYLAFIAGKFFQESIAASYSTPEFIEAI